MKLKILASLKRKYGPLPLWAWAAIAGVGAAVWWRMRKPADTSPDAIAEPSFAYGSEADYGDTGGTPAGSSGTAGTEAYAPEAAGELYPDNKLREATMELVDQIRGATEDVAAATGEGAPPSEGGADVTEPDTGDTASVRGVRWGGRTFTTRAGLAKWLAQHGAGQGNAGRAFATWAKRHPGAAATLSGKAPKPKPPAHPKAPKRTSPGQAARAAAKPGRGKAGARPRQAPAAAHKPAQTRPRPAARSAPKPAQHKAAKPVARRSSAPRSRARR
jgi:hypothetical protein